MWIFIIDIKSYSSIMVGPKLVLIYYRDFQLYALDWKIKYSYKIVQPYLPSETPSGLRTLREQELENLRGNGKGERKLSDRIYDFDVYNDIGNPDVSRELARPVLGGREFPYPRRCRTGRPSTDTDLMAERRVEKPLPMYVPRDEQFEESKKDTFAACRLKAVLHNLVPSLKASILAEDFASFAEFDSLYKEGLLLKLGIQDDMFKKFPLPKIVTTLQKSSEGLLRYDTPKIVSSKHIHLLRIIFSSDLLTIFINLFFGKNKLIRFTLWYFEVH